MQENFDLPLAQVNDLGLLVAHHPLNSRSRWIGLGVALVCLAATPLLLSLATYFYLDGANNPGNPVFVRAETSEIYWPAALAAVLLPPGAWLLFDTARRWNTIAAVYEHGLALHGPSGLRQFRWENVDAVWQAVTRRYTKGTYTGTSYVYTVQTRDGHTFKFNNTFARIEELGSTIQKHVSAALLPRYLEDLNAGQRLAFGPLGLDRQGLYAGHKSLQWTEVQAVKIDRGHIVVKQAGRWFNWASADVPHMPNFWLFYNIIGRLTNVE